VNRTKLTDLDLKHLAALKGLKKLDLSETEITDASVKHLTGLKGLELLNLRATKVTAAGAIELAKALPDCLLVF
jgi:Leucine-rich repeat (LRR) protein